MASASFNFPSHLLPSSPNPSFSPKTANKKTQISQKNGRTAAYKLQEGLMLSVEKEKDMEETEQGLAFFKSFIVENIAEISMGSARVLPWGLNPQLIIEKGIMNCRFFTLIGVFGSLLGSVLCFCEGFFQVLKSYCGYFCSISKRLDQADVVQHTLEAIDMFLVGTAMLMFGLGLYTMFIKNRRPRTVKGFVMEGSNLFGLFHLQMLPNLMELKSVEEAKSIMGDAIVMLLQAGMVDRMKSVTLVTGLDLACFAASIFSISASVFLHAHIHSDWKKLKH